MEKKMSSSARRSAFENPKIHTVSDILKVADKVGPIPSQEFFDGIFDKVTKEIAGDDLEFRDRLRERAMNNLRVIHKATKQCLLNQKMKAEEAASGVITPSTSSATTHEVKADEMEKKERLMR